MKFKSVLLIAVLVCVATACSANESLSPPEEAYNNFLRACEAGDISEAETYLTDKAIDLLLDQRAGVANIQEGDPLKKWGDPCFLYSHNRVKSNGIEFESDKPDAVEYRELDTDEIEDHTGRETGYEGVLEVADLKWFFEGNTDPLGENTDPSETTTYISTIEVMMIKINGEWKIDW